MAGGRPRKLPPDEDIHREHRTDKQSLRVLAEKYGVTPGAIHNAVKRVDKAAEEAQETVLPAFPWTVAEGHTKNRIYAAMLAYRKHNAGFACSKDELQLANALRSHAQKLNAAITYDAEVGFSWTNRLPQDGDAMFVVRRGVAVVPSR